MTDGGAQQHARYTRQDVVPGKTAGWTSFLSPTRSFEFFLCATTVMILSVAFLAFSTGLSIAQSSSLSASPVIQTETAYPGLYNGHYRPQIHFTPPIGFMNDPNGMFVDAAGVYHLYYQLNPIQTIAGNQHWGHATSLDLYSWTNQAIALSPQNSSEGIFTGSAVVDVNNTSGFFPNQTDGVVAIYTLNTAFEQTQNIAYSYDNGFTFIKYANNPVISVGSMNFRDPKVIWFSPTASWVMVVSFTQEYTIGVYTSKNLQNWTFASNFSHHGLLGYQWECPNMLEMPMENSTQTMWLMYVSLNPGGPLGGSMTQYFPGSFNGTHFTPVDGAFRFSDFGKDNYAGQFFFGIPGNQNQVSIAWASNWQYTNYVPSGPTEGWQSTMTLPRVNYLRNITRLGYDLVSEPYDLDSVKGNLLVNNTNLGNSTVQTTFGKNGGSGAVLLSVNVTGLNATQMPVFAALNFTFSASSTGESLIGGQFFGGDTNFWLDRSNTRGFQNPYFTDKISAYHLFQDQFDMQIVVDRSICEVFLLRGQASATQSFFPLGTMDTLNVTASNLNPGAQVNVTIWQLNSPWAAQENATGYVLGNTTLTMMRRDSMPGLWA